MKKILITGSWLILGCCLLAQESKTMELVGKAIKLETGEMVARRDQNGNYCAAIQVISDMDGFTYDSYDGIVGNIDDNPGQDMVYLTATERVLEVFKTGYKPLKIILSEYGIKLKSREVWQITIAGEETAGALPVTLHFKPEDAALFIDREKVEKSTSYSLSKDEHTIRLEKDGFQPFEKTITVDEKNVFFEWTMTKIPNAALQIESTPQGATVYLDGVRIGVTPLSVFFKPGNYQIKLMKDGFITLENESIEVIFPQTKKTFSLVEDAGKIAVNTYPGAVVYINNQIVPDPKNIKLSPQLVSIKVTMRNAEPIEEQVILKRNDSLVFDMFPKIPVGSLEIAVTPFNAKIELTDGAGETTTANGMMTFDKLPAGTYTISVSADGYNTAKEEVTLREGTTISKSFNLVKAAVTAITTREAGKIVSKDGFDMVLMKGGTFMMGCTQDIDVFFCSSDEKPAHQVTVNDFYIGKYEVTQKQWKKIMGNNPSRFTGCDECPVERVSWDDVQEFLKKLNEKTGKNYRLPTEAEWEYAARGGVFAISDGQIKGKGYIFSGSSDMSDVGWYDANSGSATHPVGQKIPNDQGIYDMSGNVWEWCSDGYKWNYYETSPVLNPTGQGDTETRVTRGGGWGNPSNHQTVSRRSNKAPSSRENDIGFRLARDL